MKSVTKNAILGLCLAAATATTVACGGGSASVTGPDTATAVATPKAAGATIDGTVQSGSASAADVTAAASSGLRVSVIGTAIAATTDDSGHFRLEDLPAGRAELRFEGQGIDARLSVDGLQPGQVMTVTVRVAGSTATVVKPGDDNPATEVSFTGRVDSVGSGQLMVGGRAVVVNGSTQILGRNNEAITLAALKAGDSVEVEGRAQADGSVVATKVKLEDGAAAGGGEQEVKVTGRIESTSPLRVAGRAIVTNAATRVLDKKGATISLATLKAGDSVEVEGVSQADGSVLASKIKLDD